MWVNGRERVAHSELSLKGLMTSKAGWLGYYPFSPPSTYSSNNLILYIHRVQTCIRKSLKSYPTCNMHKTVLMSSAMWLSDKAKYVTIWCNQLCLNIFKKGGGGSGSWAIFICSQEANWEMTAWDPCWFDKSLGLAANCVSYHTVFRCTKGFCAGKVTSVNGHHMGHPVTAWTNKFCFLWRNTLKSKKIHIQLFMKYGKDVTFHLVIYRKCLLKTVSIDHCPRMPVSYLFIINF